MSSERESAVLSAFVSIADSLAEGYDIVDLYTGLTTICVELLEIEWAGLLLVDSAGALRVAAASSEHARNLELFQLQCEQGPCVDCFESGEMVSAADLGSYSDRWPRFVPTAVEAGFAAVHAVPMRWRSTVLGALGLFGSKPGEPRPEDLRLARSLANVASVALATARTVVDGKALNAQLQHALDSRIIVEQAKGFLSQYSELDVDRSFTIMRKFARDRNLRLTDVALALVDRALPPDVVLASVQDKGSTERGAPPLK